MPKNFNIKQIEQHFENVLRYAPAMLGNEAVNFFTDRFNAQGWQGDRFEAWKRRKKEGKRKGRAILIDTGRLRRSIRITSISGPQVTIGTDVPYAKAHNDGFRGVVNVKPFTRNRYKKVHVATGKFTKAGKERMKTVHQISGSTQVKAFTRRMNLPQRKFMGNSPYLTARLNRLLKAELMKGLR